MGLHRQEAAPSKAGRSVFLGHAYTFLALDATSKAIVAYRTGKRDALTTEVFVRDLRRRVLGAPVISSDAYAPYRQTVVDPFAPRLHYGQVQKHFSTPSAPDAARRYSPGPIVSIETEVVYGSPAIICTSHVERQNLNVRMASRRFTRLTNGFSKHIRNRAAAVSLFVGHHNYCRIHEALRTTPAMALGVTDHVWSVAELIRAAATGEVDAPQGRQIGRLRVIDGGRSSKDLRERT